MGGDFNTLWSAPRCGAPLSPPSLPSLFLPPRGPRRRDGTPGVGNSPPPGGGATPRCSSSATLFCIPTLEIGTANGNNAKPLWAVVLCRINNLNGH